MRKDLRVRITFEIGTHNIALYPHAWHYPTDDASKGSWGFCWLFVLIRLDYGRPIFNRWYADLDNGLD